MNWEYKILPIVNSSGDTLKIREIPFAEYIRFYLEHQNLSKTDFAAQDALFEKYFIEETTKPFSEFSESERLDITKQILDLNVSGGYLSDFDRAILMMSIQYRMDPQLIMNLPCSYGSIMMSALQVKKNDGSISKQDLAVGLTSKPSNKKPANEKILEREDFDEVYRKLGDELLKKTQQ